MIEFLGFIFKGIFKLIKKLIGRIKTATKKELIIFGSGVALIVLAILSWNLVFSRYYIFMQEEKQFLKAVKDFYYYHPEYLPKNGNIKTKYLSEVYKENRLEELKIPKRNGICDLNSWVKVYNDNGEYKYHTYLKCGNISSRVDHEGPVITLNGDTNINVSIGEEYHDLGILSVKDNKDGTISSENITVKSNVDTSKLGTYQVTYQAKDKMNNVTTVIRSVHVVRSLSNIAKTMVNEEGYVQGSAANSYVLFSGNLFKILKVNDDKTVMVISVDGLNNIRYNEENYENSKIDKFLNEDYLNVLSTKDYVVEKEYCVGNITSRDNYEEACNNKITRKVSLLSYYDLRKTLVNNITPACSIFSSALANKIEDKIIINSTVASYGDCTDTISNDVIPMIRPVLTLKADLVVTSGNGKMDNPFKLQDYNYGKTGNKLNQRIVGEYVNYSGMVFRISKINEDGTVKLISTDSLGQKTTSGGITLVSFDLKEINNYSFNITDKNNVGYELNKKFIDYMNESGIINTEYAVPVNDANKKISDYELTKLKAKISIPASYDMYSATQNLNTYMPTLLLDKSTYDNKIFFINPQLGRVYEVEKDAYVYTVRPAITLNANVAIKEGKGTVSEPYYLR